MAAQRVKWNYPNSVTSGHCIETKPTSGVQKRRRNTEPRHSLAASDGRTAGFRVRANLNGHASSHRLYMLTVRLTAAGIWPT